MSASDEERAFWQAILNAWDDDTPRLVYADWLDEHGHHERAELIRVQCEAECLPKDEPRRKELEQRGIDLSCSLAQSGSWDDGSCDFRRGFFSYLSVKAPHFVQHAKQFEALGPIGRAIIEFRHREDYWRDREEEDDPYGTAEDFARLAQRPEIANWRDLEFGTPGEYAEEECFYALIRSPHLAQLRSFAVFADTLVGDAGVIELASLPTFAGLRRLTLLNIYSHGLYQPATAGDVGAHALATSPYLTRLEEFAFYLPRLGDAAAAALISSANFGNLRSLALQAGEIGSATMEALVTSPHLDKLEELELGGHGSLFGDNEVRRLVTWSGLARITKLTLSGWGRALTDASVRLLANCPSLANMKSLSLAYAVITPHGVATLLLSPHLGRLERLGLEGVQVGDVGVAALLSSPHLRGLRFLSITSRPDARISAENVAALREQFGSLLQFVEIPNR